ncbi:MAG: hypothetical protein QOF72_2047, partial [Blastocatellia bacterium]|nr:hypothetical protein [Blastocatellia bacterium]
MRRIFPLLMVCGLLIIACPR